MTLFSRSPIVLISFLGSNVETKERAVMDWVSLEDKMALEVANFQMGEWKPGKQRQLFLRLSPNQVELGAKHENSIQETWILPQFAPNKPSDC